MSYDSIIFSFIEYNINPIFPMLLKYNYITQLISSFNRSWEYLITHITLYVNKKYSAYFVSPYYVNLLRKSIFGLSSLYLLCSLIVNLSLREKNM